MTPQNSTSIATAIHRNPSTSKISKGANRYACRYLTAKSLRRKVNAEDFDESENPLRVLAPLCLCGEHTHSHTQVPLLLQSTFSKKTHWHRIALLAFFLLMIRNLSFAQLYDEDAAIAQAVFSKTKRILVSNYMNIDQTPANAAFWKLYDDYEARRRAIFQDGYYLLKEYSANYMTLDNAIAARLAEGFMENDKKVDNLNKRYFKKFRKLVGGLQAATLFQIEIYTQTALQNDAHMQIPIIGELQKINEQRRIYNF